MPYIIKVIHPDFEEEKAARRKLAEEKCFQAFLEMEFRKAKCMVYVNNYAQYNLPRECPILNEKLKEAQKKYFDLSLEVLQYLINDAKDIWGTIDYENT